jgi:hypothetical protein
MKGLFVYRNNEEIVNRNIYFLKESKKDLFLTGLVFGKEKKVLNDNYDEEIHLDSGSVTIDKVLRYRKTVADKKFDCVYIPSKNEEISKKNNKISIENKQLLLLGVFLSLCGIKKVNYIVDQNILSLSRLNVFFYFIIISLKNALKNGLNFFLNITIKFLFTPFIIIFLTPIISVKEFLPNFIMQKENNNDPIIGWGLWKNMSSSIVFHSRKKMSDYSGFFGINISDFMGIPITLHRPPLDNFFLKYFNYKGSVFLSIILISLSLIWITIYNQSWFFLILIPFFFLSTVFIGSVVIGHLEFLAWGFFSLSVVSSIFNNSLLTIIFLSLTILTHISIGGVCGSCIICSSLFRIFNGNNALLECANLVVIFLITGILCLFYLIPFFMERKKLGRTQLLNDTWGWTPYFSQSQFQKLIIYFIFCSIFWLTSSISIVTLMLVIPIFLAIYNSKIMWLFSQYTVDLSMIIIGSIAIFYSINYISLIFFLLFAFHSPQISFGGYYGITKYQISIRPFRLGKTKEVIRKTMLSLPAGSRIALEGGNRLKNYMNHEYNALISYVLIGEPLELLNGFGAEIADPNIYYSMVQHLSPESNPQNQLLALMKGGADYFAVYSESLKHQLRIEKYEEVNSINLSEYCVSDEQQGPILTIFKVPIAISKITPLTPVTIEKNLIFFFGEQDVIYQLKYSYYPGWKAFQNGKELTIQDMRPGMIIESKEKGQILLKYKFRYYYLTYLHALWENGIKFFPKTYLHQQ